MKTKGTINIYVILVLTIITIFLTILTTITSINKMARKSIILKEKNLCRYTNIIINAQYNKTVDFEKLGKNILVKRDGYKYLFTRIENGRRVDEVWVEIKP